MVVIFNLPYTIIQLNYKRRFIYCLCIALKQSAHGSTEKQFERQRTNVTFIQHEVDKITYQESRAKLKPVEMVCCETVLLFPANYMRQIIKRLRYTITLLKQVSVQKKCATAVKYSRRALLLRKILTHARSHMNVECKQLKQSAAK